MSFLRYSASVYISVEYFKLYGNFSKNIKFQYVCRHLWLKPGVSFVCGGICFQVLPYRSISTEKMTKRGSYLSHKDSKLISIPSRIYLRFQWALFCISSWFDNQLLYFSFFHHFLTKLFIITTKLFYSYRPFYDYTNCPPFGSLDLIRLFFQMTIQN